jgi:hypothetical protein
VSFAPANHHDRYRDYWPSFNDADPSLRATNMILDTVEKGTTAVFVTKPPERAVMEKAIANFNAALDALPACAKKKVDNTGLTDGTFIVVTVKNDCS